MQKSIVNFSSLEAVYPKTFAAIASLSKMLGDNLDFADFEFEPHFFPMYLRQKKMPMNILELSQFEWIQASHQAFYDQELVPSEHGLKIIPGFEVISISQALEGTEVNQAGLWAFFPAGEKSLRLNFIEAKLLDFLSEEVVWSEQELVAGIIEDCPALSSKTKNILESLQHLKDVGILI